MLDLGELLLSVVDYLVFLVAALVGFDLVANKAALVCLRCLQSPDVLPAPPLVASALHIQLVIIHHLLEFGLVDNKVLLSLLLQSLEVLAVTALSGTGRPSRALSLRCIEVAHVGGGGFAVG